MQSMKAAEAGLQAHTWEFPQIRDPLSRHEIVGPFLEGHQGISESVLCLHLKPCDSMNSESGDPYVPVAAGQVIVVPYPALRPGLSG